MAEEIEIAKKKAAHAAVDEFVTNNCIVGVGSGSTIVYAIERLSERVKNDKLKLICVPTSNQTAKLIKQHGLPLSDLNTHPFIDVCIDGADEVDEYLNLIKGGGACHTQEKLVASNAKVVLIICDYRKESRCLGDKWKSGVPIEVLPVCWVSVTHKLKELGGTPKLRMTAEKTPVVTDNQNYIIDFDFGLIHSPGGLNAQLKLIPGVVETGLFLGITSKVYFGQADGSVTTKVSTLESRGCFSRQTSVSE